MHQPTYLIGTYALIYQEGLFIYQSGSDVASYPYIHDISLRATPSANCSSNYVAFTMHDGTFNVREARPFELAHPTRSFSRSRVILRPIPCSQYDCPGLLEYSGVSTREWVGTCHGWSQDDYGTRMFVHDGAVHMASSVGNTTNCIRYMYYSDQSWGQLRMDSISSPSNAPDQVRCGLPSSFRH